MKKTLLLSVLLAISNFLGAQSLTHSITAAAQVGQTLHGTAEGLGLNLQYDLALNDFITLSAAAGFLTGTKNYRADYSGEYNGEPYFRTLEFFNKEKHINLDLTLLCRLTNPRSKYALRLGAGASILPSKFEYPDRMIILRGEIIEDNYSTSTYVARMAHAVLENEYKISERFAIHFRAIYRTTFAAENLILSEVNSDISRSLGSYTIQHNWALSLGAKFSL